MGNKMAYEKNRTKADSGDIYEVQFVAQATVVNNTDWDHIFRRKHLCGRKAINLIKK